ncbi:MAG TPA: fluoride efflux transporter CrcB [Gaiellaceae bacterium]|jgi:CrcB protein|nr:fluoride efflux transporter CrcB [Gaiellaceae bacterium]
MPTIAGIAIAGALGALARYGLEGLVSRRTGGGFPWGTFAVNVTGAFTLGLVFTLLSERYVAAPWLRSAATIGFLGAYTTFSTLSFESYRLLEDGAPALAVANLVGSCAAGLLAVYLGVVIGRAS